MSVKVKTKMTKYNEWMKMEEQNRSRVQLPDCPGHVKLKLGQVGVSQSLPDQACKIHTYIMTI